MQLPKQFPFRPVFQEFLEEYMQCETYWYIPKARSVNDDNIDFVKRLLEIIFDGYLDRKWGHETQKDLLERLIEEKLLDPRKRDGTDTDRTALTRILKKFCEAFGLLYVKTDREFVITDAGLDIIASNDDDITQQIIERQIIKYQYPNPSISSDYNKAFKGILPLIFLLQVIIECNNKISFDEYELFVNLAKSQDDLFRIVRYIKHWRDLSEDERKKILDLIKNIPMKTYHMSLESDDEDNEATRFDRIKKNGSYQRSFFCFTRYLDLQKKEIVCANPAIVEGVLKLLDKLKTPLFTSIEDWFAYFGDTSQEPSWFNYLALEIEKAKTEEELTYVHILIQANQGKLTEDENEEIHRRQIEKDIESFYVNNLNMLEEGLTLVKEGRQYITPIGRIDLLCKGSDNSFVVVEVKAIEARDSVFGQILRYIGWIHRNVPEANGNVRGIILARQFNDKARYSRIGLLKENASQFLKFKEHKFNVSDIE